LACDATAPALALRPADGPMPPAACAEPRGPARPESAAQTSGAPRRSLLATQPQLLDHFAITLDLGRLEVVEQAPALTHHPQQATARRMIALVDLEVLGEVLDLLGQQRDLDFGR